MKDSLFCALLMVFFASRGLTLDDRASITAEAATALAAHHYALAEQLYGQALQYAKTPASYDGLSLARAGVGRIQPAIEAVQQAIALNGEEPMFHYHLALFCAKKGDHEGAIHQSEDAIRLKPDFWEAKYALSDECLKVGDLQGAIDMLERVIHARPNFAEARLNLALTWMQLDQNDTQSIRELLIAENIDPGNASIHLALGELYAARNEYERAIEELQRSLEIDPGNPEGHYNLGLVWRLNGAPDRAEAELRQTLRLNFRHALAHKALGLVFREQNRMEAARDELRLSVEFAPGDSDAYHLLGSVLLRLNAAAEAVTQLREAVRLNPMLPEAYYNLSAAFAKLGRPADAAWARAQAESARALKAKASRSTMLLVKAEQMRDAGDFAGAIAALRESVGISPGFSEANFQLAKLLSRNRRTDAEVERLFRRVLEATPRDARAYLALGTLLIRSNRQIDGVELLRHALRLAPSLAKAHVELGKVFVVQKQDAEAIVEFGAVLAWETDNVEARVQRGEALIRTGYLADAAGELQAAIHLQPRQDAYYYLGCALKGLGRASEAAESFRMAKQLKRTAQHY